MENILYRSTRSNGKKITASAAILQGLAPDGGLYVPDRMPVLDRSLSELAELSYQDLAYEIIKLFLTDFTEDELRGCINKAYDSKFDIPDITKLREADGAYYLELFHGATIAFKDMALSLLPHLMTVSAAKNNIKEEIVILTATSGDTGKAALAGFAGVPGTKIIVFYPQNGVSAIQKKQMVTQTGDNVYVLGVRGNFDDTQNGVKAIFSDQDLQKSMKSKGYVFSSANSINIGRLIPQVVYYVNAYCRLMKNGIIKEGEKINFTVPTGNFGDILAGYYAKLIGLPVNKLICASNENKVLYDFFVSGTYDKNRQFILTSSPSMDILISSNLERLIFRITGENAEDDSKLMKQLRTEGRYQIPDSLMQGLAPFSAGFATEEETSYAISSLYKKTGYVIDTHTAVAAHVYNNYRSTCSDKTATVILSTASPYKFAASVMKAIAPEKASKPDFELIDELSVLSGVPVPNAVQVIRNAPVIHNRVCNKEDMSDCVADILNIAKK